MVHKAFPVEFDTGVMLVVIASCEGGISRERISRFISDNHKLFSDEPFVARVGAPLLSWHSARRMIRFCRENPRRGDSRWWLIAGTLTAETATTIPQERTDV